MPDELTPDSFMAGLGSTRPPGASGNTAELTPDAFMSGLQKPTTPSQSSSTLPTPQQAKAQADLSAGQIADMLTHVGEQMQSGALAKARDAMGRSTGTSVPVPLDPMSGAVPVATVDTASTETPAMARLAVSPQTGADTAVQGTEQIAQPGLANKAGGASKIIRGSMQAVAPVALPAGFVAAPLEAVGGLTAGALAQEGVDR